MVDFLLTGDDHHLTDVTLSRCSLNDDTCSVLIEFLFKNPTLLERLDLSENQLTSATLLKFASLLTLPDFKLKYLSLRYNCLKSKIKNDWETEAVNTTSCALSSLFRSLKNNKNLLLLDISHNSLNFTQLSVDVLQDFAQNESLIYVMIGNNRLIVDEHSSDTFGQFFSHLPQSIAHLDMSCVGMDSQQMQPVYEALLQKPNLKHLCLSDNMFGRESCTILGQLMINNTTLKSLNISNSHILDSGARILSQYIGINCNLECLKLSRNRIGRAALDIVSACVEHNKQGELAENHQIKLRVLDLSTNGIMNDVLQQIEMLQLPPNLTLLTN
eukprot:TRINITY_DN2536_c0_g1_i1.p1 TRINITY_DN2536_c0_g1~~TRINITY_DN2536_c0_g1_i1.p1  ORF type:complete len:329 (+),score=25.25 TRINITY_DN2536_c0_g1_i1:3-989(+)